MESSDMKYGDLTYQEIAERIAQGCLSLIPTGCTEQQGPHLPVDSDTWFAETLLATSDLAAQEYGAFSLVPPALPFGPTPEHRSYGAGYIDVPERVHAALVSAILDSLATQGFQRMPSWHGCGGHDLEQTVKRFNQRQKGRARALLPALPYHAIGCRVGDAALASGHADSFTTSLMLHLRPEAVRLDRISDPHSQAPDWSDPRLDFRNRFERVGMC
jgi:creatinine amidohydrolase